MHVAQSKSPLNATFLCRFNLRNGASSWHHKLLSSCAVTENCTGSEYAFACIWAAVSDSGCRPTIALTRHWRSYNCVFLRRPYDSFNLFKLDCIGHVSKREAAGLRENQALNVEDMMVQFLKLSGPQANPAFDGYSKLKRKVKSHSHTFFSHSQRSQNEISTLH